MKYLGYVFRNIRRNPIRTLLTVASISVCLFLMMTLLAYIAMGDERAKGLRDTNRLITMNSQGLMQPVPVADVAVIAAMDGVATVGEVTPEDQAVKDKKAVSPYLFYGGRYKDEQIMGAQFGVDPDTIFALLTELKVPKDQIKAFREDSAGCVIGQKVADEKNIKIGDSYPLSRAFYDFPLNLTVRGIYQTTPGRDGRTCFFHWNYLNEGLKRDHQGRGAGSAGTVYFKVKDGASMSAMIAKVDGEFRNSSNATKTQSDEAFLRMFNEMVGDLQTLINFVGLAVAVSLICVCGVAMAMSMRERTTEIAVLKAIGFGQGLILTLVLLEAMILSTLGGLVGAIGTKLFFDVFDLSKIFPSILPFFYIPWNTALLGLGLAVSIGFLSGVIPAFLASRMSVIQGLRKVV